MIDLHVLTLNTFINEIILEEHLRSLIKLTIILRSVSIFVNIWHQEWICPVLLCSIQVVTECLGIWVDISRPTWQSNAYAWSDSASAVIRICVGLFDSLIRPCVQKKMILFCGSIVDTLPLTNDFLMKSLLLKYLLLLWRSGGGIHVWLIIIIVALCNWCCDHQVGILDGWGFYWRQLQIIYAICKRVNIIFLISRIVLLLWTPINIVIVAIVSEHVLFI